MLPFVGKTRITKANKQHARRSAGAGEIKEINMSDLIDRQAAIDALDEIEAEVADGYGYQYAKWREYFIEMPSAQPDIIRCRNCKFASGDSRICMKFDHTPIGELDFCAWAERRTDEE